jgi:hypothetical protein
VVSGCRGPHPRIKSRRIIVPHLPRSMIPCKTGTGLDPAVPAFDCGHATRDLDDCGYVSRARRQLSWNECHRLDDEVQKAAERGGSEAKRHVIIHNISERFDPAMTESPPLSLAVRLDPVSPTRHDTTRQPSILRSAFSTPSVALTPSSNPIPHLAPHNAHRPCRSLRHLRPCRA